MSRALIVLYAAIGLDAVGIGLIFPILPRLIEDVTHVGSVVPYVGALAVVGTPALQSFASRLVDENRQGQFQGMLASAMSLASIVGPLLFSNVYFVVRQQWPGAIWLSALVINAIAVPIVLSLRFDSAANIAHRQE